MNDTETGTILYENQEDKIDSTIVWNENDDTLLFLQKDCLSFASNNKNQEPKGVAPRWKRKDILKYFGRSITPSINGHEFLQNALVFQLFWGYKKILNNDETLFFLKMDDAHHFSQVSHKSRDSKISTFYFSSTDKLLLGETAELFSVNISKSQDGQFLFISSYSQEESEVHYLSSASENANQLLVVAPCLSKVFYEVQHYQNQFYIVYTIGGTANMRQLKLRVQPHSQDFPNKPCKSRYHRSSSYTLVFSAAEFHFLNDQINWKIDMSEYSNSSTHKLLCKETDELFWVTISKSQNRKFFFLSTDNKETDEVHFLSLATDNENQRREGGLPRLWLLSLRTSEEMDENKDTIITRRYLLHSSFRQLPYYQIYSFILYFLVFLVLSILIEIVKSCLDINLIT